MTRYLRKSFSGTSASVAGVLMLTNATLATVLKAFVVLVLCLLVEPISRALGPFIDETGRLMRDCVVYLRRGLRRLFA